MTMDYRRYTPDEIGELNVVIDELRAEVERLLRVNAELIAVLNSIGRTANQAAHMGKPKP